MKYEISINEKENTVRVDVELPLRTLAKQEKKKIIEKDARKLIGHQKSIKTGKLLERSGSVVFNWHSGRNKGFWVFEIIDSKPKLPKKEKKTAARISIIAS
jgi:hypothetical protein